MVDRCMHQKLFQSLIQEQFVLLRDFVAVEFLLAWHVEPWQLVKNEINDFYIFLRKIVKMILMKNFINKNQLILTTGPV